jgi:hypothetical protein
MDKRKQEKFDKPVGILMPLLMYRWRIIFPNESEENGKLIAMQATKLAIDYSTRELSVTIRQDLHSMTLHNIFSTMMGTITNRLGKRIPPIGSSQTILIEYLDGSADKATAVLELDCSPKGHTFELNYENGGDVSEHNLVFRINNVKEYENIEITEEKEKA